MVLARLLSVSHCAVVGGRDTLSPRCPAPPQTVPRHPLGDGCQVTVPHPPLGNCTTTVHAPFQAQNLHRKTKRIQHNIHAKDYQCSETNSLTGSV